MPFESEKPVYVDEDLCAVQIFVPSQMERGLDRFALMASVQFSTFRDEVMTQDGPRAITVGLHSATLTIETCDDSAIDPESRYRSAPLTFNFKSLQDELNKHGGDVAVRGTLSVPLLQRMIDLSAKGGVSAETAASREQALSLETTHEVFEVEPSTDENWAITALNPARPTPHLKGGEVHQVLLCDIETPKGVACVSARLRIEPRDLWLDVLQAPGRASLEDDANQRAVLSAIVGASAQETGLAATPAGRRRDRKALVAEATLRRVKGGRAS